MEFGPFVIYALILGVGVMSFTFFVNLARGFIVTVLGLAMAYYLVIADASTKDSMDIYMKNLFTSISGGDLTDFKSNMSTLSDNLTSDTKEAISNELTDTIKESFN
jgi:hypothetical protein